MRRERERIHASTLHRERHLSERLRRIAVEERPRAVRKFCQLRNIGKRTGFVIQCHDRNEQRVGCRVQYVRKCLRRDDAPFIRPDEEDLYAATAQHFRCFEHRIMLDGRNDHARCSFKRLALCVRTVADIHAALSQNPLDDADEGSVVRLGRS
ncbi:unknown [Eggerthella sp. CAG:298]|nr:unknown [Eggerthella sp. CAG:298]